MKQYHRYILSVITPVILSVMFLAGYFIALQSGDLTDETASTDRDGIVPYEQTFKAEAERIGWDWTLVAAVCYEESHFNPNAKSQSGALGLMQLMPTTAQRFGLNDSTVFLPEENIRAGVSYIAYLQETFSFIGNPQEQIHFVLASYNAGPAHIMDARRLAKAYGRSPYVWFDNTEYWLERLQEPDVANDTVVWYGSFNATETVNYVRKVLRRQQKYEKLTAPSL